MIEVSILMSCFNSATWLEECIESVLNQSFGNFEFIIINDGSTDDTSKILDSYLKKDKRIVVINKENSGLANSLNLGIKKARSNWIARIDADDISFSTRIDLLYNCAKRNQNIKLLGSWSTEIDYKGDFIKLNKYPTDSIELKNNLFSGKRFFSHSSAFFHKETAVKLGLYREYISKAEDLDLWLRFSEITDIKCIDIPLVKVRKHNSQISNFQNGDTQIIDKFVVISSAIIRERYNKDPIADSNSYFEFFNQVKGILIKCKYLERRKSWSRIRQVILMKMHPISFIDLKLIDFYFLPHNIYEYLYGSHIQKKIVKYWCKAKNIY